MSRTADPATGAALSLAEGETILWQGQPAAGLAFRRGDLLTFAIAGYFFYGSLSGREEMGELAHWTALLLCLGLLAEIFVLRRYVARRTRYVLTDRRAIILRPGLSGMRQDDYPLASMALISLRQGRDGGTGAIGFAETLSWSVARTTRIIGFERLRDAAAVHARMLAARKALGPDGAEAAALTAEARHD